MIWHRLRRHHIAVWPSRLYCSCDKEWTRRHSARERGTSRVKGLIVFWALVLALVASLVELTLIVVHG
jgi:hypothetical protein